MKVIMQKYEFRGANQVDSCRHEALLRTARDCGRILQGIINFYWVVGFNMLKVKLRGDRYPDIGVI